MNTTDTTFDALEAKLGYRFTDRHLLELALTHRSCGAVNNERLEFLGDAALGYLVASRLYHEYREASEHDLTLMRVALVKGRALATVAQQIGLGDHMRLGTGERKSGGHRRDSLLANALEAVIGAVVIDGGIEAAGGMVGRLFADNLRDVDAVATKDAKTVLQEYLQARGLPLPDYQLEAQTGEAHAPSFRVSCHVRELDLVAEAVGPSRRDAEKAAAARILDLLHEGAEGA